MPRVIVASDKFKSSLTSAEVAAAIGRGVRRVHPDTTVIAIPVADGGDGTLAAAVAAGFDLIPTTATGPTGTPTQTTYARRHPSTHRDVAVIELADVSGLVRLPGGTPAPMTATSRGTGELLAAAIDAGCRKIILGIGGSASTDGGAGLVRALGARLLGKVGEELGGARLSATAERGAESSGIAGDGAGSSEVAGGGAGSVEVAGGGVGFSEIGDGGAALAAVCSLDLSGLRRRLDGVQIVVACDVDNPLTGPDGAAAVYGPQKGADARQVAELDAALTRWADLVARETGRDLRDAPGAGAAGGVGFAALALLGAELRPGIELVLELIGFREQLAGADLVVTGEGALDEQTLHGKAVAGVAAAAGAQNIPVVAVCGVNRLESHQLRQAGVQAAYALTDLEPDVRRCIAEPIPLLERIGERIAVDHLTMTASERGIA